MSLAWWADGSLLWDTLLLGGEVMPGIAAVTCEVERKLDIQPVKGGDGATIQDQGYVPGPVGIALKIWLPEQWTELQRLMPRIHPRAPGGVRSPLEIIHPAANVLGVHTVYVHKIAAPVVDRARAAVVAIQAVQWFPAPKPAKATKKPKASPKGGAFDPSAFDVPGPSADPAVFF